MLKNIIILKRYIHQQHFLWLMLIILCVSVHWFEQSITLRYDRDMILTGEWYRLFSANFAHLNTTHLLMNMLGVVFVLVFFSTHFSNYQWLVLIIISSLFVTFCLFLFNTDIQYYVGLSGVLHALFISGAIIEIRRFPIAGWALVTSLILKLAWEQFEGAMPGSESLIKSYVVIDSHLYGAIAGLAFIIILLMLKNKNS